MRAPLRSARVWLLAAACFSVTSLAAAQDAERFTISLGYEALRVDNNPCDGCTWNWYQYGMHVDSSYALRAPWSLLGEFAWSRHPFGDAENEMIHSGGMNALDLGGGLRFGAQRRGRFAPYGQITAGWHKDFKTGAQSPISPDLNAFVGPGLPENSLMVHPAGGVFVPIGGAWGFIGQVGYRRVFSDEGINGFHVVFGVRVSQK